MIIRAVRNGKEEELYWNKVAIFPVSAGNKSVLT